eukprot:jgi/Chrzof1/667/Cz01g24130.t1
MSCLARMLKQMAQRFNIAVLITNHVVLGSSGGTGGPPATKPALGETWRSQCHARVLFARAAHNTTSATLAASTMSATGQQTCFMLTEGGFMDVALAPT